MSTPPPPSQPPSGGFGAPQDPPPVPPGPPGPPAAPQSPAYGYPPQAGYGYPQQPAPGPGVQPLTVPTPAYTGPAPTPAPTPAPAPAPAPAGGGGGGGGSDKRTQLMIVGAALLAVVLIVAGGLWYASGDSGAKKDTPSADGGGGGTPGGDKPQAAQAAVEKAPANPKSKALFNQPSPQPAEIVNVIGSWITDSTYVKSDVAKVVGYNLVDGSKKWEIPFPGELCGATKHVSDNKTAVLFKPTQPTAANKYPACSEVGVIDLNAGKLVWSGNAKSATSGDQPVSYYEVTLSGQTVAAAGTSGGAAWSLADGKSLWLPKIDGEACRDTGYAGGEALAVIRKCGQSPNYTLYAQLLDPATGAPTASYKLSPGIDYAGIVSTKPLIVGADVGNTAKNATGLSDLFVIDTAGQLKTRISLASGNYAGKCDATEVEKCANMVVGNGKLYLPSEPHQGQTPGGDTNELLSFDLTTGKETGDRADAGEGFTLFPLRMDGPNIIAYKVPPYDKGGQIVSIDGTKGANMKETLLMTNPAGSRAAETSFSPDFSEYRYHNGKLFISRTNASKPFSPTETEFLFVSFTAS